MLSGAARAAEPDLRSKLLRPVGFGEKVGMRGLYFGEDAEGS